MANVQRAGDGTSIFVALWDCEVKPGCEKRFKEAYGPDGDWARLFQNDSRYREMRLVRDAFHPSVYLTMDFWESRAAYEKFMAGHRTEYEAIDARGKQMTAKERRIGLFEAVED